MTEYNLELLQIQTTDISKDCLSVAICLWMGRRLPDLKPCRPSRHLGSGGNFPWANVYVMWKAENPGEHSEIRPKRTQGPAAFN
ncbi:hypothetical protein EYF80_019071 [Liparis tanakae]|uniref:Uncharacterized protein n=1 Tax=Liparis tanakae TaxID=230148 RepID=A0A4Z2I027_9TELE|nr:hypothetical protein EYF80_019071 [Liparis tanakae]